MSSRTRDTSFSDEGSFDESEMVRRAQKGDQVAFEKLYERYNDRIYRYLIRMVGNDGIGCELTQETLMRAWEELPGLREPSSFASWLYRIATHRAYNYLKREKSILMGSWEEFGKDVTRLSIEGPERQIEESELLKAALAQVRPAYRPCLILYVIEDLPQRQIATILDMKESSVSKYVSRGKEEFRQIYHRLMSEQDNKVEAGKGGRKKP